MNWHDQCHIIVLGCEGTGSDGAGLKTNIQVQKIIQKTISRVTNANVS